MRENGNYKAPASSGWGYRSKDELLQRLAGDGLGRYLAETVLALADDGDPWEAFVQFMHRCVHAGAGSLTLRHAGSFTSTEELRRKGQEAYRLTLQLLERTRGRVGCDGRSRWAICRCCSSNCRRYGWVMRGAQANCASATWR
jgi:hypothetical protein